MKNMLLMQGALIRFADLEKRSDLVGGWLEVHGSRGVFNTFGEIVRIQIKAIKWRVPKEVFLGFVFDFIYIYGDSLQWRQEMVNNGSLRCPSFDQDFYRGPFKQKDQTICFFGPTQLNFFALFPKNVNVPRHPITHKSQIQIWNTIQACNTALTS